MLDKLKQAFTDSDWPAIDPILLPLDLHEAEALLSHVPEAQQLQWEGFLRKELRMLLLSASISAPRSRSILPGCA